LGGAGHNAGVSTSRIVVHGRTVEVEINALGRDYEKSAGVRNHRSGIGRGQRVALAVMARPCSPTLATTLQSLPAGSNARLGQERHCRPTPRSGDGGVDLSIGWQRAALSRDPVSRHGSYAAVPALAAFNIGVEIGQVVIVALIFPLLLWSIGSVTGPRHARDGIRRGLLLFSGDLVGRALLAHGTHHRAP